MDRTTLYDDWKARRERLAQPVSTVRNHDEAESQVLDYLLRRFHEQPEAAQPARFVYNRDVYFNYRAVVVLHHLSGGRGTKVSTQLQAQTRIRAILQRMRRPRGLQRYGAASANRRAPQDPMEVLRMRLCDIEPKTRIAAITKLGEVGTLDDIGLFSDLLSLPPQTDEHPFERAALLHAMQRLAGIAAEPFDLAERLRRSRTPPKQPAQPVRLLGVVDKKEEEK